MLPESIFSEITEASSIEVFDLVHLFREDESDKKVNLSVGVYRTEEGSSFIFPVIEEAERLIVNDPTYTYDYLPPFGPENFHTAATELLLGEDSVHIKSGRAFGLQSLSGTGGLRLGAEFLARNLNYRVVYNSSPCWDNHSNIFRTAGFTDERAYRYFDDATNSLDFDGMIEDLRNAPEGAVIVLQVCGHNPAAVDPSREQWNKIADVVEERKLFPFFDAAYHGFVSGDIDKDLYAVRYFADRGIELFCAQSFAKNFGIYNVRCGALIVVTNDPSKSSAFVSLMSLRIYYLYETPPAHGARLVGHILNDPKANKKWRETLKMLASRITYMREMLKNEINKLKTPGTWDYITQQKGMFAFTALTEAQVKILREKYHIYLLKNGRLNICGLNEKNIKYVAKSIHDVVTM